MSNPEAAEVPSPCIGVCELEAGGAACRGCQRTMDEIREWPLAGRPRRLEILEAAAARAAAAARPGAGPPGS